MQRVLVVDDEQLIADTLTLIFGKSGFEARAAYSAEEAMDSARTFEPNLLLCDVSMPGKDGLGLMMDMSREFPACRTILLTGFYANLSNVHQHIRKLGKPVGLLTKPCEPAELLREANSILSEPALAS